MKNQRPTKPQPEDHDPHDVYSRVDYRRFVAWPKRIQREAPLLERLLSEIPDKSVLDLGCGTGEHTRFLHEQGYAVLGIDQSGSMIEKAREQASSDGISFQDGNICELDGLLDRRYGGAICLGNTLPHLNNHVALRSFLAGLRDSLLPGGQVLFQLLNYERILNQEIRYLPLNFRDQENHEAVFLRLMKPRSDGRILFCPTTLRFDPSRDEPVEVVRSRRVELMGWQRKDLYPILETNGLEVLEEWGDVEFSPFSSDTSSDLVLLVRRTAGD